MSSTPDVADWRPLVAALANEQARRVYAGMVLGHSPETLLAELSPSRRAHIEASLISAGLITRDDDTLRTDGGVFARILAAAPRSERRRGIDRFLDDDGRIVSFPAQQSERLELLRLIAGRTLTVDDVVSEAELNERLSAFSPDVALLRRRLVDAGLVERTRSGSQYSLSSAG